MRWCIPYLSVCIVLTGCIATTQNTGSLDTRVTRLEGRIKNLERSTGESGSLEKRLGEIQRDQQYLKRDFEELTSSLTRLEESSSALRIDVSRLKDRFDQIERSVLAREEAMTTKVDSVASVRGQFQGELDTLRAQTREAMQKAADADALTKTATDDLYDRMNKLSGEVESLYNDLMGAISRAAGPAEGYHVVKAGENLGSIARAYGVTVDDVLAVNPHITKPSLIRVGEKIRIP